VALEAATDVDAFDDLVGAGMRGAQVFGHLAGGIEVDDASGERPQALDIPFHRGAAPLRSRFASYSVENPRQAQAVGLSARGKLSMSV